MNVGAAGGAQSGGGVAPSSGGASIGASPETSQTTQTGKVSGGDLADNSVNQTVNNNTTIFTNTNMSTSDILSLREGCQSSNGLSQAQSVSPMGETDDMQKMLEQLMKLIMMMMIMKMMQEMMGSSAGESSGFAAS